MKKKSILLMCIVAIMALAMFVGCDNAPNVPAFPTGGFISQKVDLLEGQVIPANAFDVIAVYTNGQKTISNVTVTETTTGKINGKADNGEALTYSIGFDYQNNPVVAKGQLVAYPVDHITAVLNEGVAIDENTTELKSTDVTVTAYYVNNSNDVVSKLVSSGDVDWVSVSVNDDLSAEVTVSAFGKECEIEATAVAVPAADVAYVTVQLKTNAVIPQLDYEELPEITDDLVSIIAYDKDWEKVSTLSVSDVEVEFVDSATFEALNGYNFKANNSSEIGVKTTYGDIVAENKLALTPVELRVQPVSGFALVEGSAIGTPSAEDFIVDMWTTGEKPVFVERVNSADVELTYLKGEQKLAATFVPQGDDDIWVNAAYLGVNGSLGENVYLTINEATPVDVMTITATVADGYKRPAKQIYDNIGALAPVLSDLASINVTIDYAEEGKANFTDELEAADFGSSVTVAYSASGSEFKPLTESDYLNKDTVELWIYVTYTNADGLEAEAFVDVAAETAADTYVSDIELEVKYENTLNGNPMADTTMTYTVTERNDLGVVSTATALTDYTVLVNGYEEDEFDNKVDTTAFTLRVAKSVTLEDGSKGVVASNIWNVPAGTAYTDSTTVTSAVVALKEGEKLSLMAEDVLVDVIDVDKLVVNKGTSDSTPVAGMTILGLDIADSQKATSDMNTVPVRVSYIDNTGATQVVQKNLSIDVATWLSIDEIEIKRNSAAIPSTGLVGGEERYKLSQFSIADGSFVKHGTEEAIAKITQIVNGTQTITEAEKDQEFVLQGDLVLTISYPGHDGTATTTVRLSRAN